MRIVMVMPADVFSALQVSIAYTFCFLFTDIPVCKCFKAYVYSPVGVNIIFCVAVYCFLWIV